MKIKTSRLLIIIGSGLLCIGVGWSAVVDVKAGRANKQQITDLKAKVRGLEEKVEGLQAFNQSYDQSNFNMHMTLMNIINSLDEGKDDECLDRISRIRALAWKGMEQTVGEGGGP